MRRAGRRRCEFWVLNGAARATSWCPRPPGQTRMRYDGTSSRSEPASDSYLGCQGEKGSGPPATAVHDKSRQIAGAIDKNQVV